MTIVCSGMRDLEFPWHAHKRSANTDSLAEVLIL